MHLKAPTLCIIINVQCLLFKRYGTVRVMLKFLFMAKIKYIHHQARYLACTFRADNIGIQVPYREVRYLSRYVM
jgi:hypothetical protein